MAAAAGAGEAFDVKDLEAGRARVGAGVDGDQAEQADFFCASEVVAEFGGGHGSAGLGCWEWIEAAAIGFGVDLHGGIGAAARGQPPGWRIC